MNTRILRWIGCYVGNPPHQILAYEHGFAELLTRLRQNAEPGSRHARSADPYREYLEAL